jgi:WD40 repeat protein
MWNADKGAYLNSFAGHEASVTCGDFTPDGIKQLLILFFFFFLKTFRFSLHWIYFFHLFSPYLPASGKTICTGSDDASLRIWNPKSGENIHVVRGIHLYPAPFHVLNKLIYLVIT